MAQRSTRHHVWLPFDTVVHEKDDVNGNWSFSSRMKHCTVVSLVTIDQDGFVHEAKDTNDAVFFLMKVSNPSGIFVHLVVFNGTDGYAWAIEDRKPKRTIRLTERSYDAVLKRKQPHLLNTHDRELFITAVRDFCAQVVSPLDHRFLERA